MKNLDKIYSDSKNVTNTVMNKITYGGKGVNKLHMGKWKKHKKMKESDEY